MENPIKLNKIYKLELVPTSPFHFDSTFYNPGHFPTSDCKWESGKRWQTFVWGGKKLGTLFEDLGTKSHPKVGVIVFSGQDLTSEFLESLKKEIIWRYNLDLDLVEFYSKVGSDRMLKPSIKRFYGLRTMSPGSLYEYLVIAIVLQNATVRRSVYMMQVLFEKYGTLLEFDNKKFWCFWEPEVLAEANEQDLRNLKVGYRAKSLIKVSIPFTKNQVDEISLRSKSEEEQEKALISLYGIGPASVGYIMLDVFHRWGFLKNISPWEQKIYTKLFFNKDCEKELVPVSKMLKYFERWGKWKNLAIHYVWQDIWWKRRNKHIPWLEKLIRL